MRFCMVTTFYPPYHFGGDATYVRALSQALVAAGHDVEVIHCEDAYRVAGGEKRNLTSDLDNSIVVHRLKSGLGMLSPLITQQTGRPGLKYRQIRNILKRDFDVVNFHNISLVGGPGVLELSRAPVTLYTLHEHWLLCPTHIFWKNRRYACDFQECFTCSLRSGIPPQLWRYTRLISQAVNNVDLFLSPSAYTARRHSDAGFNRPIRILPLFSMLEPENRINPDPARRPSFLYVGRVTASKGIVPLLDYFSGAKEFDLVVVGTGDLDAVLRKKYLHHNNITFAGHVSQADLITHYQNATALVFPSLAPETFGLSIVEAFACGTPAIVHDSGGSRELVEATGGGIIYNTEPELKKAVESLASDYSLRMELGNNARNGFERYYTRDIHLADYLGCVESVIGSRNTKSH